MAPELIIGEIAVLRALAPVPLAPKQIATTTDLPWWTVRSIVKELERRDLIERAFGRYWDRWQLTDLGETELRRLSQMKLAPR